LDFLLKHAADNSGRIITVDLGQIWAVVEAGEVFPCLYLTNHKLTYLHGPIFTESLPSMGIPLTVLPFRTPSVLPQ
jgi:hypothetical protein